MAILGAIRKQTWLLIVVIGVAMLAFLAGDLFSQNSIIKRVFTGDPNQVGSVNGEPISLAEFLNMQSRMSTNPNMSQNQISEQVWNTLVSQKIIKEHAEKAGLEVSDDEVWAALAKQYQMADAEQLKTQVGQLKTKAQQGVSGAADAYNNFLAQFESAKPSLLYQKYSDLISMGVATTKKEAEFQQISNVQSANIDYAFASYDDLKKKYKVEVTDDEINAYIKKYPKHYEREASVNLSYVYFPAQPSKSDEAAVLTQINQYLSGSISVDKVNNITDTIPAFANAKNDSIYVSKYSDGKFISQYITKKDIEQYSAQLPEDFKNFLLTAKIGQVGGPFKTGNAYQLVKLSKSKEIADSINSSHILISYKGTDVAENNPEITRTRDEAKVLADSILNMAKANPGNFTKLVAQYSDDQGTKVKNGNLGWVSSKAQNLAAEYLQFLNIHKTGEIGLTESKFGFHIIKIDGEKTQPGYQIANIIKNINPSQETSDKNFADARNFAQEVQGKSLNEFANLAQKKNYNYNSSDDLTRFNTAPLIQEVGNDKDNEILKWAFNEDTKPGSTYLFTTNNEDHIIVHLNSRTSEGLASAKSVRSEVEPILIQEKLVKMINEKLGSNPSLDTFVTNFGAVKASSSTTFGSAQIAGKGAEPKVAGAAFGLKPNQTSKAIAGKAGVYVVTLKSLAPAPKVDETTFLVEQMDQSAKQKINQQLMNSLQDAADIKDTRAERLDRQY